MAETTITEDAIAAALAALPPNPDPVAAQLARVMAASAAGDSVMAISRRERIAGSKVHAIIAAQRADIIATRKAAQEAATVVLEEGAERAARSLVALADGAEDEGVRMRAAESVLDRIGVVSQEGSKAAPAVSVGVQVTLSQVHAALAASVQDDDE